MKLFQVEQSSMACNFPITYTATIFQNSTPIAQPAWITFDHVLALITINKTIHTEIGVY